MKITNRVMKKGIAVLLSLALLVGICPVDNWFGFGEEVKAATEDTLLFVGDFEDDSENLVFGNTAASYEDRRIADAKRSGEKGFRLIQGDVKPNPGEFVQANLGNLEAGATYEISVWVKRVSETATVSIIPGFYKSNWGSIKVDYSWCDHKSNLTGEWQQYTQEYSFDELGIIQLNIYCNSGEIYLDDITITKKVIKEEPATANVEVFPQGTFEGDNLDGWSGYDVKTARSADAAYEGEYGLPMTETGGNLFASFNGGFESGATYKLSYMARNKSDADSTVKGYVTHWTDNWGADYVTGWHELDGTISNPEWQEYSYEFVVPAGYAALQVVYSCSAGAIDIDNFSIKKIKEPIESGLKLESNDTYKASKVITTTPKTFEAAFLMLANGEATIAGNTNYGVKLNASAHPVLVWGANSITFNDVTIPMDIKVHLAISVGESEVVCYVDGVEKQKVAQVLSETEQTEAISVGANTIKLYSLALFSDARDAKTIGKDIKRVEYTENTLLLAYDFHDVGNDRLEDHSASDAHLIYSVSGTETEVFDTTGLAVDVNDNYLTDVDLSSVPVTYRAEINLPADLPEHEIGGVILGNDATGNMQPAAVSFEIRGNGNPSIYYRYYEKYDSANNAEGRLTFSEVDVRNGDWTEVVISLDFTNRVGYCFINGELKQTLQMDSVGAAKEGKQPKLGEGYGWKDFIVGGDYHYGNEYYFRGKMKSVSAYYDAVNDYSALSTLTPALSYTMTHDAYEGLTYNQLWKRNLEKVSSYEYSMAVVGDTQTVIWEGTKEEFDAIYDYIVDEATTSGKMAYCIGLGDITEKGQIDWEYELAAENFEKMETIGLPYSLIRGNHDVGSYMDKYFPYENFKDQIGGSYNGSLTNTWQTFEVGGVDYMILCLDYFPSVAVLEWADSVVKAHPNHNVILTTHGFLTEAGERLTKQTGFLKGTASDYPDDGIWTELVEPNSNIQLVLSGHISSKDIVRTKFEREDGTTVETMLIDPQSMDYELGSTSMVAMFYFGEADTENNKVDIQIQYYSTTREEYYSSAVSNCTTSISLVDDVTATSAGEISGLTRTNATVDGAFTDITMSYTGALSSVAGTQFSTQITDTSDNTKVNAEVTVNADNTLTFRIPTKVMPAIFTLEAGAMLTSYDLTKTITITTETRVVANTNITLEFTEVTDAGHWLFSSNYNTDITDKDRYQFTAIVDGVESQGWIEFVSQQLVYIYNGGISSGDRTPDETLRLMEGTKLKEFDPNSGLLVENGVELTLSNEVYVEKQTDGTWAVTEFVPEMKLGFVSEASGTWTLEVAPNDNCEKYYRADVIVDGETQNVWFQYYADTSRMVIWNNAFVANADGTYKCPTKSFYIPTGTVFKQASPWTVYADGHSITTTEDFYAEYDSESSTWVEKEYSDKIILNTVFVNIPNTSQIQVQIPTADADRELVPSSGWYTCKQQLKIDGVVKDVAFYFLNAARTYGVFGQSTDITTAIANGSKVEIPATVELTLNDTTIVLDFGEAVTVERLGTHTNDWGMWGGYKTVNETVAVTYYDLDGGAYTIPTYSIMGVLELPTLKSGDTIETVGDYTISHIANNEKVTEKAALYKLGDANADGKYNAKDIVAAKKAQGKDAEQLKRLAGTYAANVDKSADNIVSTDDLGNLRKAFLSDDVAAYLKSLLATN